MDNNKKSNDFNPFRMERNKLEFSTKLKPHILKIELPLAIIASLGYLLSINEIIYVSLILLSTLYFFMSFADYVNESNINVKLLDFIIYIVNYGRSMCIVGILFAMTNWPGRDMMLSVGLVTQLLSLVFILYFFFKNSKFEIFTLIEFFRSLIIFSIAILFYYMSNM